MGKEVLNGKQVANKDAVVQVESLREEEPRGSDERTSHSEMYLCIRKKRKYKQNNTEKIL